MIFLLHVLRSSSAGATSCPDATAFVIGKWQTVSPVSSIRRASASASRERVRWTRMVPSRAFFSFLLKPAQCMGGARWYTKQLSQQPFESAPVTLPQPESFPLCPALSREPSTACEFCTSSLKRRSFALTASTSACGDAQSSSDPFLSVKGWARTSPLPLGSEQRSSGATFFRSLAQAPHPQGWHILLPEVQSLSRSQAVCEEAREDTAVIP